MEWKLFGIRFVRTEHCGIPFWGNGTRLQIAESRKKSLWNRWSLNPHWLFGLRSVRVQSSLFDQSGKKGFLHDCFWFLVSLFVFCCMAAKVVKSRWHAVLYLLRTILPTINRRPAKAISRILWRMSVISWPVPTSTGELFDPFSECFDWITFHFRTFPKARSSPHEPNGINLEYGSGLHCLKGSQWFARCMWKEREMSSMDSTYVNSCPESWQD
jgi:hypothetical protein